MLTVPFCSTVEAENLGAIVTFDASNMPMVKGVQDIDKLMMGYGPIGLIRDEWHFY